MSAFVVSDRCLNNVAQELHRQMEKNPKWFRTLPEGVVYSVPAIAVQLAKMNIDAVNYRYDEESSYPEKISESPEDTSLHKLQTLKDFHCYLYQCSEGTIPETALFLEVEKAMERMELTITKVIPKFKQAELSDVLLWG
jgi:hypothetical protein